LAGTYSVNVLNAGTAASAISAAPSTPVTDPSSENISTSTSFTLTVGGNTFNIQPAAQNLNSLASAINSSGAGVQAVVVNLGSPSAPSYQLVVQNSSLGDVAIQLNDGQNDLLASLTTGANASYTVNGQPPGGISTDTSTVTIAPGLNITIEKAGSTNVTVAANLNGVSNALTNFVSAYNATVSELQKNRGQSGGALTGDSIIQGMQQALSHIVNYTGSGAGSISSLTQLGVEFTSTGTLTFDPTAISGLSQSQVADALSFLGDPNTGGLLQFASNTLSSITDPLTGVIASESQALQNQMNRDQAGITADQARINALQASLQAQMAKADALIATLQQQNTFLQGLFQFNTSNNQNAGITG
jgi:flagellar hook-associated protein 2